MNNFVLNLKISGITCDACLRLIKKRLGNLDGISEVTIEKASGETIIASRKKLSLTDVNNALTGLPYKVGQK